MTLRKRTDLIVVHVTATPPDRDIGAKEVDAMHRARGWNGIGYHYVIRRDGTIEKGRPENQVGAHVAGWNSVSLGVSLVGGVDASGKPQDNRTPAQNRALEKLLRDLVKKYPGAKICGHRDLSPDRDKDGILEPFEHLKACPCFDAIPWAKSVGLPAADIRGAWVLTNGSEQPTSRDGPDERIAWLQKLLHRAGYEFGAIDGIIGPKTRDAIKRFQAAAGFDQTGEFDAVTVKRLREMAEAATVTVEKKVEVNKPTVPETVEKAVKKKTGFWQWLTGLASSGALGLGWLAGMEWQAIVAIGGVVLVFLVVLLVMRRQIIGAVGDIRKAVEQ